MPGHVKKSDGPDPDPSPWLLVSPELKIKLKSKPYDPKKSCWVPNKATHGYDEGLIDSTEGDKVTVMILESKEVFMNAFWSCITIFWNNTVLALMKVFFETLSLGYFASMIASWHKSGY